MVWWNLHKKLQGTTCLLTRCTELVLSGGRESLMVDAHCCVSYILPPSQQVQVGMTVSVSLFSTRPSSTMNSRKMSSYCDECIPKKIGDQIFVSLWSWLCFKLVAMCSMNTWFIWIVVSQFQFRMSVSTRSGLWPWISVYPFYFLDASLVKLMH